jgi:hypothetical protein
MVHADSETESHVKLVFHFIVYQTDFDETTSDD